MAHTNLGEVLQRDGRAEESIAVYEAILERNPDDVQARGFLAVALSLTGEGGGALAVFDEILGSDDGEPLDYFSAGVSLYTAEEYERAALGFKKALEGAPMYRDALQNLVQSLNVVENYEAQVPYSERLLELDPYNALGYQMHARALVQVGRQAEGITALTSMQELPFTTDYLSLQPMAAGCRVTGQASNKTLEPGTTITLRFTFYDNDGNPVGSQDAEITLSDPDVPHAFQLTFDAEVQVLGYGIEFVS
jgi:tetratricopeptide (TPR) repeat protein